MLKELNTYIRVGMKEDVQIKLLSIKDIEAIAPFGQMLNPDMSLETFKTYLTEMFELPTYYCFGLFYNNTLIGISSGWISIRFYSGKQLEVDNVIIDEKYQSKGLGKQFFEHIENWAKANNCNTVELNTYTQNTKSHKFYYNQGYNILGFHFLKWL